MPEKIVFKNIIEKGFCCFKDLPAGAMFRKTDEGENSAVFVKLPNTITIKGNEHSYNCVEIGVGLCYVHYRVWAQLLAIE